MNLNENWKNLSKSIINCSVEKFEVLKYEFKENLIVLIKIENENRTPDK